MKTIKTIFNRATSLVGMCLLLGVISAQAATLTVNTTADAGLGSLRQAIIDATTNAEANIVTFTIPTTDPGYDIVENRFTINLLGPLPDLPLAALSINATQSQNVTVNGNNTFRIFTLVNSAVVSMTNLTISNGFSDNGLGGGIYMGDSGTLTLIGSTVRNNTATNDGGGIYMNDSGTLWLFNSTIRNNTAANNGGGIYIHDSGTLNIDSSTVSGNTATTLNGGAIFNGTSGTVNATSNTIDGNSAGNNGGGIYNTATITLTNNTVTSNTAANGGGIYNDFVATLNNNLVALNTATDGNDLLGRGSLGDPFTGSFNLIGNADGSEGVSTGSNQAGTTMNPILPLLGPLQSNGGLTFTRALLTGSPAIDTGNSPSIITDQRGFIRPYDDPLINNNTGNGADIGSYEVQANEGQFSDLSVTKTDSPDPVVAGHNITYTISVTNNGSNDADNVVLTDSVPANTTFQSLSSPSGFSCTVPAVGGTGAVSCSAASLANGATATFTFVVNVNANTPTNTVITNTANVTSGTSDPNNVNISATATTPVAGGTAPTIFGHNSSRTRNTSANVVIATVNDVDQSENTLVVTATPLTGTGVTITNISVSATGVVTATVTVSSTATVSSFTLTVRDASNQTATATLKITVITGGRPVSPATP